MRQQVMSLHTAAEAGDSETLHHLLCGLVNVDEGEAQLSHVRCVREREKRECVMAVVLCCVSFLFWPFLLLHLLCQLYLQLLFLQLLWFWNLKRIKSLCKCIQMDDKEMVCAEYMWIEWMWSGGGCCVAVLCIDWGHIWGSVGVLWDKENLCIHTWFGLHLSFWENLLSCDSVLELFWRLADILTIRSHLNISVIWLLNILQKNHYFHH